MRKSSPKTMTVFILSVSSDIGLFLAQKYLEQGCRVFGTYRNQGPCKVLKRHPHCRLMPCDVHDAQSVVKTAAVMRKAGGWDIFISCVGHPLPMTPFFKTDFGQWQESVTVNCTDQLRVLHAIYPYRRENKEVHAAFFAGGGTNNAVVNFSAYTIGKVVLTKMCEFLNAEEPQLNPFIIGPGWTRTKIHETILKDPCISAAKRRETRLFMDQGQGTSLEDIFECIQWLCSQGKAVAGGRNFSVVHDPWKAKGRAKLATALKADQDMYKLRRHGNNFSK